MKEELFAISTDIALKYVITSLTSDEISILLKGIRKCRNSQNSNLKPDNMAFLFYKCALKQVVGVPCLQSDADLMDEDWVDQEDSDGESPEDREFEEENFAVRFRQYDEAEFERIMDERVEAVEKYIKNFSTRLRSLSDECDLVFHNTVHHLMMRTVVPRIYSKYWETVRKLISEYKTDNDYKSESLTETRKNTDELLERKLWIVKRYPEYNATVDRIGEFNLLATATEISLNVLRESDNKTVVQMFSDLVFNEITKDYSKLLITLLLNV